MKNAFKYPLLISQFINGLLLLATFSSAAQSPNSKLWNHIDSLNEQAFELAKLDLDSAEQIIYGLFEIVEEPIDTLVYAKLYSLRGIVEYQKGEYQKSIESHFESLKLREQQNPLSEETATAQKNLANMYYYANAYDQALTHLMKSIQIKRKLNLEDIYFANDYNLYALILWENEHLDSASFYFEKGLNMLDSSAESNESRSKIMSNLSGLYIELEAYEKAEKILKEGIELTVLQGEFYDLSWDYMRLGSLYNQMEKYKDAEKSLRKADSLSQYSSTYETQSDIKYFLFQSFLKRGMVDSAQKYILQFIEMNDSLISQKTQESIQEMAAKYELERNATLLELAEEEAARFAEQYKNQRILLFVAVVGLVLLIGLLFFLRNFYHQRRKLALMELEIKENKMDELMSSQESKTYAAMLKGQQQERERIARDLHDRLGGTLAALKHSLRSPDNKIKKEDLEIVDQAVKEVRDVSHNLASAQFADFGLNEALTQLKATIEKVGEVKFDVYLHPATSRLKQKATIELYRIVQELLSNTLKHAKANQISVQTNFSDGIFNLIYEDNGVGFDLAKAKRGMGLDNMRARVNRLNGVLNIDTEIGRGTIVIIEINQKS